MKRKTSRRIIQYGILICVLIFGGIAIGQTFLSDDEIPKIGGRPPEFSLQGSDGQVYRSNDYEGQALVINFWGTFCPPCVIEMPEFQRQYEKWESEKLEILAINLSEDKFTVNNFAKRFDLTFPLLLDQNRTIERRYKLKQYPTTFFVKPDGKIMDIFIGGMTEKQIDDRIRKLLDQ